MKAAKRPTVHGPALTAKDISRAEAEKPSQGQQWSPDDVEESAQSCEAVWQLQEFKGNMNKK